MFGVKQHVYYAGFLLGALGNPTGRERPSHSATTVQPKKSEVPLGCLDDKAGCDDWSVAVAGSVIICSSKLGTQGKFRHHCASAQALGRPQS